jgi:hypothetical protein
MIGALCSGKSDFEAIKNHRDDDWDSRMKKMESEVPLK